MKNFAILLTLAFLLNGCARKDPVETIIDNNIEHFTQVLDYAHNNMEQNADVVLLENELDSCIVVLDTVKQSHYSQMDKCESETDYWRLSCFYLIAVLALGVLAKIKRWL